MTGKDFQKLLDKLGSEKTSQNEFNRILAKIRENIRLMEEVRVYVDNSPNFGHQSSTIALMRQFIDWFEYPNRITVFFRTDPGSLSTQNKLALLLPEIDVLKLTTDPGGVVLSYGTCPHITFAMIDSDAAVLPEPDDFVILGFTGGSDSSWKIHKLLKTRFFLCLQPYMWHKLNRIECFSESFKKAVTINLEERVGEYLKRALFFYNEQALTSLPDSLWKWYTTSFCLYDFENFNIKYNSARTNAFRLRLKNAYLIPRKASEAKALLWPIYGLQNYRHHSETLIGEEELAVSYDITGEILFNLVLTGLTCQLNHRRPVVMLLFNTVKKKPVNDFDLNEDELFGYIRAFIAGTKELQAYFKKKDKYPVFSRQEASGYSMKSNTSHTAGVVEKDALKIRNKFQRYAHKKVETIHILEYLEESTTLTEGHFYILKTGSVPMDIFNYFFWNAGMPPFFEGQGTSSLTILSGRPFLQCSQAQNYHSYPTTVFSAKNPDPIGRPVYDMVMLLVKRFLTWTDSDSYYMFIDSLSTFITNSCLRGKTEYQYFQKLRKTYSAPNHSKLFLGLINMYFTYQNSLLNAQKYLTLPAKDQGQDVFRTLEDVYAALTAAVTKGQGCADLLEALPGTRFAEYFYDVSEGKLSAAIDLDKIEKTFDPQGKLCQVSVSQGTVSLFGMDFSFSLVFSYAEYTSALVSVFSCSGSEGWALPGIPWICLENFGFGARVFEGDLPVAGCLTGRLKGTDMEISIAYPVQDGALVVQGEFPCPVSALEPFYQAAGGINFIQSMPEALRAVGGFGLKSLSFVYSLDDESCLSMEFCLKTDKPWTIMESPDLSITPEARVIITAPGDLKNRKVSFQIGGQLAIGKGILDVTASYPGFRLQARLIQDEIDLNSFVEMFGGTIDLKSSVSAFELDILPREHVFFLDAGIRADWNLSGLFTIKNLCFHIGRSNQDTSLFLSGEMVLLPDTLNLELYVQGSFRTASKGWQILARQSFEGNAQTAKLLSHYLGWNPKQCDLLVANVEFMMDSASQSWRIAASTQEDFQIPFLQNVALEAQFVFGKEKNAQGQEQIHALLSADFKWNGIDLLLWYNYDPKVQSFGFTWNQLTAAVSKNQASQWVGVLRFTQEVTLGNMIETMVSWIRGSRFGLEAPWDSLNKIPLSGLELEYNFTTGQVGFEMSLGEINLGFAKITGVQVSYGPSPETGVEGNSREESDAPKRGVMVTLAGEFPWNAGESASGDVHSLGPWDASDSGQAPAPNGSGNKYFDLDLLALGQHVTCDGFSSVTKVEEAIALMEKMSDPGSAGPYRYDLSSSWMIGADLKVLKLTGQGENGYMLRVQTVFNDPVLYALRIVLSGQAAKVLSGLEFEILYKKIKDNLGVYQADITLPDAIRYINLGGISITLPIISVAVYTNGDFQVDIGFPWNSDFSRSFSIEALVYPGIPLTGSGGFYFGMLSGETCSRVPQSQKGIFNPVLVFGLGLKVGVGKSFHLGILDAGFSLTVVGILEGVIAKWNPYTADLPESDSHSLDSSYYYCLQGTVGVIGWLYGKVDFGIIKANVNIAISLMVRFLAESYRPIELSVQCQVDICLNISINLGLFKISISLSFSAKVRADFLIEARGQAPWLSHVPELAVPDVIYISGEPDEPVTLDAYLVTALTIAHDEWESLEAAPRARHTCYVAVIFLESSSFALLLRALLDWLLKSRPDALKEEFLTALSGSGGDPEPLPLSDILEFLNSRIRLTLHEKPLKQEGADSGLVENAVYFPMIPWLNMEAGPDICYTFSDYNEISAQKLEELRTYFDQLAVAARDEGEKAAVLNRSGNTFSMAEWVFADYFLMLSRQLLRYSLDEIRDGHFQPDVLFNRALGDENIQQLAAMATRYCLHGLRLTTDGIRPLTKGIWVNDKAQLPPIAGLFALTGQQLIIPPRLEPEDTYTLVFTMPQKLSWLDFEDGKASYTISVPFGSEDAKRIENVTECWKDRILSHKLVFNGTGEMVQSAPLAFAFSSWQAASAPEGLPLSKDTGAEAFQKVSLWNFPGALTRLCSGRSRGLTVSLSLEGGEETDGTAVCRSLDDYALGCLVSFGIRKPDSDGLPMYEITGGRAEDILLLERMVSESSRLSGLTVKIGYTPSQGALTLDGDDGLFTSFIKVNLSTETHPSDLQGNIHGGQAACESILLLWEALITSQGGFYLYYCVCRDGSVRGLPDAIFDERGRASVSLLVLFNTDSRPEAEITNYMNVLVTPDLSGNPELAPCVRTVLRRVEGIVTSGEESIGELCEAYDSIPMDFIERNPDIRLNRGAHIKVEHGVYLVRPQTFPGGSLDQIGKFFKVTGEELKAANPERTDWPSVLEEGEALILPPVTITADEGENHSLARISEKYGCSLKLLAALNRDTPGILAPGQPVSLMGGLRKLTCAVTPGVAAATFTVTPPSPGSDPEGEALELIMNQYTLLGYHVKENCSYRESNLALPAGPRDRDGLYGYTIALPLSAIRKNSGSGQESPYSGAGTLLQLDYHWQDLFGNLTASQFSCKEPAPDGFINGMPLFQGYTDELLPVSSWPCVNVSCLVEMAETGQRYFKLLFLFDTGKYEEFKNPETLQQYAALDRKVYQSLYYQLSDPLGVEFKVTTTLLPGLDPGRDLKPLLCDWLFNGPDSIYGYLCALEKGESPSLPAKECCHAFPFDLDMINQHDLFRLDSAIEWHRCQHLAAGEFASMEQVFSAVSVLPPKAGSKGSLSDFAGKLESALREEGSFQIRLAAGLDEDSPKAGRETLWLVRQGESPEGGICFRFCENRQVLTALRPISNHLEGMDGLCLPVYETGSEIVPEKTAPPTGFRAVDLDLWMKTFVTAMDELLSPQMIMAVIRIDAILGSRSYDALMEQKQQLALGLKDYLVPVLKKDRGKDMDFLRENVRQQLLAKLSDFYEIQGAVETEAVVSRGPDVEPGEKALKLFGTVKPDRDCSSFQVALYSTKLDLQPGKQPFACFIKSPELVRDRSGAILPGAVLNPVFTGSNLEHRFRSVTGIDNYQASGWLSFVQAGEEKLFRQEMGEFYMPFLLRSYPETPQLGEQDYIFDDDRGQGLSMLRWNFRFRYERSCHYPQDRVEVKVHFNRKDVNTGYSGENRLFGSLAAFVSLYPRIREDLLSYACKVTPDMTSDSKEVACGNAAIRSFLYLSRQVVLAAGERTEPLVYTDNAVTYSFCLRESVEEIQGVNALVACVEGAPPSGLPWPSVTLEAENQETVLWKEEQSAVWYWFRDTASGQPLEASRGQLLPSRRLCFPNLYMLRWQSASAELCVKRNRQEIGDSQVDDCFIYQTETVSFSDTLYPFMDIPEPVELPAFSDPVRKPKKLREHLTAFFRQLLKNSQEDGEWSVTIGLEARYAYQTDPEGSFIELPVFLQPSVRLEGDVPEAYIDQWSQALDDWREKHITASSDSTWNENAVISFDLTVFSDLADTPMPLLHMHSLQLAGREILL